MIEYCATVYRGRGGLPTEGAFWELHRKYNGVSLSHPMMDSVLRGKCHLVWIESERKLTIKDLRSKISGLDIESLDEMAA